MTCALRLDSTKMHNIAIQRINFIPNYFYSVPLDKLLSEADCKMCTKNRIMKPQLKWDLVKEYRGDTIYPVSNLRSVNSHNLRKKQWELQVLSTSEKFPLLVKQLLFIKEHHSVVCLQTVGLKTNQAS